MSTLRFLTEKGIDSLEAWLEQLAEDPAAAAPLNLLTDAHSSAPLPVQVEVIDRPSFASKLEMSRYLAETFPDIARESGPHARGLWAWLSLLWIDLLMPPNPGTGERDPNMRWYYVPDTSHFVEYRHLLLGPYRAFREYGEQARLLLVHPLHVWSDVEEQLAGKREILRLPGALAAADLLYFDASRFRVKRGITNRKKPGTVRRLLEIVKQYNRTYDLYSMTGAEVVSLLPPEFDRFRS